MKPNIGFGILVGVSLCLFVRASGHANSREESLGFSLAGGMGLIAAAIALQKKDPI